MLLFRDHILRTNTGAFQVAQCQAGDGGLIPGSGRSPGGGNDNPVQYACLDNPMAEELGGLQSMGFQESDTTE